MSLSAMNAIYAHMEAIEKQLQDEALPQIQLLSARFESMAKLHEESMGKLLSELHSINLKLAHIEKMRMHQSHFHGSLDNPKQS